MYEAAKSNTNPAVIAALVKAGADPEARNRYGFTPLQAAAGANTNPEIMAALVKEGITLDVQERDSRGRTLLHWASRSNTNPDVLAFLLEQGANLNLQDELGWTPLHWAAGSNRNPEIITDLIERGADVKAQDKHGYTPLHMAAELNETPEIIGALLEAGADLNAPEPARGRTPLHLAADSNFDPAIVAFLLEAGADPNDSRQRGQDTGGPGRGQHRAQGDRGLPKVEGGAVRAGGFSFFEEGCRNSGRPDRSGAILEKSSIGKGIVKADVVSGVETGSPDAARGQAKSLQGRNLSSPSEQRFMRLKASIMSVMSCPGQTIRKPWAARSSASLGLLVT